MRDHAWKFNAGFKERKLTSFYRQCQSDPRGIPLLRGVDHQSPKNTVRNKRVEDLPAGFGEIRMSELTRDLG